MRIEKYFCFRFLWISRRPGTLNWERVSFWLSKNLYKQCDVLKGWNHLWRCIPFSNLAPLHAYQICGMKIVEMYCEKVGDCFRNFFDQLLLKCNRITNIKCISECILDVSNWTCHFGILCGSSEHVTYFEKNKYITVFQTYGKSRARNTLKV